MTINKPRLAIRAKALTPYQAVNHFELTALDKENDFFAIGVWSNPNRTAALPQNSAIEAHLQSAKCDDSRLMARVLTTLHLPVMKTITTMRRSFVSVFQERS